MKTNLVIENYEARLIETIAEKLGCSAEQAKLKVRDNSIYAAQLAVLGWTPEQAADAIPPLITTVANSNKQPAG